MHLRVRLGREVCSLPASMADGIAIPARRLFVVKSIQGGQFEQLEEQCS